MTVVDNSAAGRFELVEQGHTSWATYRREPGTLVIDYVFSPEALRGQGTAGRLMQGIVDEARAQGLQIVPVCGYAASWLRRHG